MGKPDIIHSLVPEDAFTTAIDSPAGDEAVRKITKLLLEARKTFEDKYALVEVMNLIERNSLQTFIDLIDKLIETLRERPNKTVVAGDGKTVTPIARESWRDTQIITPSDPLQSAAFRLKVLEVQQALLLRFHKALQCTLPGDKSEISRRVTGEGGELPEEARELIAAFEARAGEQDEEIATLQNQNNVLREAAKLAPPPKSSQPTEIKIDLPDADALKILKSFFEGAPGVTDPNELIECVIIGRRIIVRRSISPNVAEASSLPRALLRISPTDTVQDQLLKICYAAGVKGIDSEDQKKAVWQFVCNGYIDLNTAKTL